MPLWHRLTERFMSSILSKSRSFTILTMTCQRMIMWTLLLLLTACVSVESTKRYIWETTVIKLSKTSHGHVSSLFRILSKKSSDSWMCCSRSILLWRRRRYSAMPSALLPLLSTMNLNPQKHWQIWTYMSLLTSSLKKERIAFLILMQ